MKEKGSGRTVEWKLILPALFGIILIILGTATAVKAFAGHNIKAADISEVSWTEIKNGELIYTDEMNFIDPFLRTDGSSGVTEYCLVSYKDASGDMCIGVLSIPENDGLYDFLRKYLDDKDASLGTYAVSGYFAAGINDDLGEKFSDSFTEACGTYAELFKEGSGLYYNGNVQITDLNFRYRAPVDGEPSGESSGVAPEGIIGIVIALIGAAELVYSVGALRKKRKEDL